MFKLLAIAVFVCIAHRFYAQDDPPEQLREVMISGYHFNDSLMRAPGSIGILTETGLSGNNQTDISQSINTIPGILMQSGALNTNRISIRGIGARTPFGTNKIRAFYGSIPLTSGDSETTIEDLNIENISAIEVIRGPLSSRYGAGLGGAIIISPKFASDDRISISNVYGSFGLMKSNVSIDLKNRSSAHRINYHKLESDGWRENSAYDRESVMVSGELFRKEERRLTYLAGYTSMKAFIPSSVTRESFDNDPQAAAPTWLASKGFEEYWTFIAGLAYDFTIGNFENSTSIFANFKDSNEPRPFDILKQDTHGFGARTQFKDDFKFFGKDAQLLFGAEYFRDRMEAVTFENLYLENPGNGSLQGERLSDVNQIRTLVNGFAQLKMSITGKFGLQAGMNINKTTFSIENEFPVSSTQNYGYDAIFSPQLSLLYNPTDRLMGYVSASHGFSMPAIEETLTESGQINTSIKPENGYNLEVGTRYYFSERRYFLQVSAYAMKIRDLLVARRVDDDQYVGANAGRTFHRGVEAELNGNLPVADRISINGYLSVSLGKFTFDKFVDRENDYSGHSLPGVPESMAATGITFHCRGFYVAADLTFVDSMPMNDSNLESNDSYRLVNLKAGYRYRFFRNFSGHFSTGINNLFDERYASMILVNATGFDGAQPRFYYPGLPLHVYVNFGFEFRLR